MSHIANNTENWHIQLKKISVGQKEIIHKA